MKKIIVLGATGSVGTQALDVARKEGYAVTALSANRDVDSVEKYAREFNVKACAMADEGSANALKCKLSDTDIKVYSGDKGIVEMINDTDFDTAVNSTLGMAGLMPSLAVVSKGKRLALANKESMVIAGEILNRVAKENRAEILPVDSEHCAIHQCLKAGEKREVSRLILTASGGPFFGKKTSEIKKMTLDDALAHPTWKMGAKITVDSATLMNKGFEVIEACRLFDVPHDKVDVVVHRQSIIHSMVEFCDNSVMAQLSVPDMRFCVQYAVNYPDRCEGVTEKLDFFNIPSLTFDKPDTEAFPLLAKAYHAVKVGGALPCVLNAANEIAVAAFLSKKISFADISELVISAVDSLENDAKNAEALDEILAFDSLGREHVRNIISRAK
ncbi:MAG: 1-deoxy-D-xylulose-5-phosphate reductoisomerase [Ruminococcaceae bacterium]|nr:1-deoxy-D-xylulose-5-phosphate reductoisomerase [Oscillospiraceae bacterium]